MWKNFHRKVVAFDIYCQFVSEMLTPFAKLTTANDISREYYPKIWNERETVSEIYTYIYIYVLKMFCEKDDMKSEQREMCVLQIEQSNKVYTYDVRL